MLKRLDPRRRSAPRPKPVGRSPSVSPPPRRRARARGSTPTRGPRRSTHSADVPAPGSSSSLADAASSTPSDKSEGGAPLSPLVSPATDDDIPDPYNDSGGSASASVASALDDQVDRVALERKSSRREAPHSSPGGTPQVGRRSPGRAPLRRGPTPTRRLPPVVHHSLSRTGSDDNSAYSADDEASSAKPSMVRRAAPPQSSRPVSPPRPLPARRAPTGAERLTAPKPIEVLKEAAVQFNIDPNKGIAYLERSGIIDVKSPLEVASFLLHTSGLSKRQVGECVVWLCGCLLPVCCCRDTLDALLTLLITYILLTRTLLFTSP